jgi:hypothetical protein
MRPTFRRAAIVALVVASLAPGLIQGRPFNGCSRMPAAGNGDFFSMVWSLLADVVSGRVPVFLPSSPFVAKDTGDPGDNGGRLDPNGSTTTTLPPDGGDNGGRLDPNG